MSKPRVDQPEGAPEEKPESPLFPIGPESGPEPPYPRRMEGKVIGGYQRGSKELGYPTANIEIDLDQTPWIETTPPGVFFGWVSLLLLPSHPDRSPFSPATDYSLFPMVMSIGYNPTYENKKRSAEVHIYEHKFAEDFYGVNMRVFIAAYIRPEVKFVGEDWDVIRKLLKEAIERDISKAKLSLVRAGWKPQGLEDGTLDCSWLLRPSGGPLAGGKL